MPTINSSAKPSLLASRNQLWLGLLAVALLTVCAHFRGLNGDFVLWDDDTHVTQNPVIRALTWENVRTMFTQPIAKLYAPLTWFSFAVDYQFWGHNPRGYHVTNLVLHTANALLVFLLVGAVCNRAFWLSLVTALLFGVHPLRVESVAWITERKDVLFVFFYLLGLLVYLRRGNNWLCFALFVASALSKSAAVTFPLVLLLLDAFVLNRRAWLEKIPFFLVSIVVGIMTVLAQSSGVEQTVAGTEHIALLDRLGLVGFCSFFYVRKFFWPFHLSAIYPTFDEMHWNLWINLGYIAAFVAATVLIVALRKRWPWLLGGWLFYLITLLPTIGLAPVGIHVVADRYCYLPFLGLAFLVSRYRIVAVLALALVLLSVERTKVWVNSESLFQSALAENPDCLPAHVNLTLWYTAHKQFDQAIAHGQRAVEIAPHGLPGRKNLAYALINDGQHRKAIEVLRPATTTNDPEVWRALRDCFTALGDEPNAQAAAQHLQNQNPP